MNEAKKSIIQVPPNSKESEMMVLGCMLTSIDSLNTAAEMLKEKHFYYKEHQIIFSALKYCYVNDAPADVHIIAEELKRRNKLDEAKGVAYLTTLVQYAGTAAHLEEYAKIVKEKALLRDIIKISDDISKKAFAEPENVYETLEQAQASFFEVSQVNSKGFGTLLQEIISGEKSEHNKPYLTYLQEKQEEFHSKDRNENAIVGIPTHFCDFDKMVGGMNNSNLMILAARPAMGKTALAINLAENICFKSHLPVGIFSLEMTAEQLMHRIVCSQAEVESEKIKTGSLNGMEYQKVVAAINNMMSHKMVIDDEPGLKISDLRTRARRMKEAHNIGFLIIDYLQLISGSSKFKSSDNRQMEISEISRSLKTLARELNIPILCLSQLSRKVEERQGHRPMMSDLRESGSIEQDSDLVMFLLRKEYYDPYDKPGQAELIVAKNRHGSVGSIHLTFRKELAQFANFTQLQSHEAEESNDDAFAEFSPS